MASKLLDVLHLSWQGRHAMIACDQSQSRLLVAMVRPCYVKHVPVITKWPVHSFKCAVLTQIARSADLVRLQLESITFSTTVLCVNTGLRVSA